jgi:hypothetical protein
VIHDRTKRELEQTLERQYGAKMRQALPLVRQFRQSKDLNEAQQIASTLGNIFTPPGGPTIEFGGRIGLKFTQPKPNPVPKQNGRPLTDHPIQLGDFRVGFEHNDRIEASVSFYSSRHGVKLKKLQLRSEKGININKGREFASNARLVLQSLSVSADGTETEFHLGASETILGLAALIELLGGTQGAAPSGYCHMCSFAELPAFTSSVELEMRRGILELVKRHRTRLIRAGVSRDVIRQFIAKETCVIGGLECQQLCNRWVGQQKKTCVARCRNTYKTCIGGD